MTESAMGSRARIDQRALYLLIDPSGTESRADSKFFSRSASVDDDGYIR